MSTYGLFLVVVAGGFSAIAVDWTFSLTTTIGLDRPVSLKKMSSREPNDAHRLNDKMQAKRTICNGEANT